MNVIEILKRSDYHYRPTEEEWDEIWQPVRDSEDLMNNDFIRSLYSQWEKRTESRWRDTHPRLSPAQVRCLVQTVYGKKPKVSEE